MKKYLILFPILFFVFGFITNKVIDDKVKKLLTQFNTTEDDAKSTLLYNITGSSYYIPNIKVLKNMALGERTEMVNTIGSQVKEYVKSKEFLTKYNEYREGRKPTEPEKPKYSAQLKEEQRQNLTNALKETETNMKNMSGDQKKMFEDIITMYKQQLKDLDDPNNSMYTPQMDEYIKQGYDMQMENYKNDISEWETMYPINNPTPLVKKWLNDFLEKSKDIDFNASLKKANNRDVFVNSEYERKSLQWKLFYRAGKEPVEAARKFASAWLNELK